MRILMRVTAFGLFALAIVSSARTAETAGQSRAEPDRLTPGDAEAIVHLNVRQMLKTALVKKHAFEPLQTLLQRNDELRQILRAAGLDPLKDIDTIEVSTSGNPLEGGKLLTVVRGDFSPDKARAAAEDYAKKHPERLKIDKVGQTTMWEIPSDPKSFYASFVGNKALVLSAKKEDTAAAVARAGQTPPQPSSSMRATLDHLEGSETIWMAMVATDDIKQLLKSDDTTKEFGTTMKSITGALKLSDDAHFSLVVHADSPKAAGKIKDKIQEMMQLLTFLGAGKDANGRLLKEIIGNIKLNAEKSDARLTLEITEAQIEKAGKKSP